MPLQVLTYFFVAGLCLYLFGAILSLLTYNKPKSSNFLSNGFSFLASFVLLCFSISKLLLYNDQNIELSITTNIYPFSFSLCIDNLSAFFIMAIALLSVVVSVYSIGYNKHYFYQRNVGALGLLFNFFILSMLLVVSISNLFGFLVVWEIMALVSYFLVVYENEKVETQRAGTLYIIMTHVGTAFIIAAFALLYKYSGGFISFSEIGASQIPEKIKHIVFLFAFIGFGTKAGIIPLHIWLPAAYSAAPGNITALMSGIMSKTAVYGFIRIIFVALDGEYFWWGTLIMIFGTISTILGIAYALMEINIKKLLAYSSVENMGIIMIGLGLSIAAKAEGLGVVAALSFTASLLHVINHSFFKGLLFLGAGAVHYSTGTKNSEKLGGLIKKMPYTALFFLMGSLAISAIPPFNGFVSEWLTYQALFGALVLGHFTQSKILLILMVSVLAISGVLASYAMIKTFGISFLAVPRTRQAEEACEVSKPMLTAMGILSAGCIFLGLFPLAMMNLVNKVSIEITGSGILNDLQGFAGFLTYSMVIQGTDIQPSALLVTGIIVAALIVFIVFKWTKGKKSRIYGTWDCGYIGLNEKMQYTATGFSKPIRIVFRILFNPERELQIEKGASPYFFRKASYVVSTHSIIENYLYAPIIKRINNFARRSRLMIQTGSVHAYLIYIFIAILLLLLYYVIA